MAMKFTGRVAVITGAGGGLGRCYALALAQRGAKVVVNDLGVSTQGQGRSSQAAEKVVEQIKAGGGEAIASYDDVTDGDSIINAALQRFGRVDILINNAGILRDVSFQKMSKGDWDAVMQVHLQGAFACCKAAWPHMQKQKFGRIVNTASAAGLYGNYGQANYASAKLALVALSRTLAQEGAKFNITCNAIAPLAGTRMLETVMSKDIVQQLKPESIAPVVVYLCHETCKETGQVLELGAGWVSLVRWQRTKGVRFDPNFTAEEVGQRWNEIADWNGATNPSSLSDSMSLALGGNDEASPRKKSARASGPSSTGMTQSLSAKAKNLKAAPLITSMQEYIAGGKGQELCKNVSHVYGFDILPRKGEKAVPFVIDFKNAPGSIQEGAAKDADAYFTMLDDDFVKVVTGGLNPQLAFMQGKMKVKGSMKAAMKFTPDLFPDLSA